ncbi:MAG: tRNA (N(6)-L-threonylcarbamoyladenosine(37)-C(2))-methylthiotransferase MtaB [Clostridia bacterium]|nr:tRNA (N(6)-L-threonylcarbamoyladenosine(37)-C(2))-methylthiotransferase MtaB [Clostridia bacterium]
MMTEKEKTVSFCTLGCRVNQYETRSIAEQFVKKGYKTVPFGEKCDVCVVNTCAVTAESVRKSAQLARRAASSAEKVAVIGCASELTGTLKVSDKVKLFIGTKGKSLVVKAMTEDISVSADGISGYENTEIGTVSPSLLENISDCRAFVKIEDGCNGRCAYCVIPKLRGRVRLRNESDILDEIDRLCASGSKEIILTGIETAAYGAHSLSELIKKADEKEDVKRIRLGSLDPNVLTDEFIDTVRNTESFMPHLHLAVQSASGDVLKAMRRPYTKEKLESVTSALKNAVPEIMLSADIISSFPTETEEDFIRTLEYIEKYGFLHIHAFSFSPRPGTEAYGMKQIPSDIAADRTKRLISLSKKLKEEILQKKIGKLQEVLIESKKRGLYTGHTRDFCEAGIESDAELKPGDIINAPVISVKEEILIMKYIK